MSGGEREVRLDKIRCVVPDRCLQQRRQNTVPECTKGHRERCTAVQKYRPQWSTS